MASYLQPGLTNSYGKLTLTQFIQTVMVGVSGLPGTLVRPRWQAEPPKQPDGTVNWMAIGIAVQTPDANAFIGVNDEEIVTFQRMEGLEVSCCIYGPNAIDTYGLIRDGFQIPQNLWGLGSVNMGFVEVTPGRRIPDLVNEKYIDRIETSVILRREIDRTYPILTLVSADGTIFTDTYIHSEQFLLDWAT